MSDEKKASQDKKVVPPRREPGDFSQRKEKVLEHIEKMEAPVKWPDPPDSDTNNE